VLGVRRSLFPWEFSLFFFPLEKSPLVPLLKPPFSVIKRFPVAAKVFPPFQQVPSPFCVVIFTGPFFGWVHGALEGGLTFPFPARSIILLSFLGTDKKMSPFLFHFLMQKIVFHLRPFFFLSFCRGLVFPPNFWFFSPVSRLSLIGADTFFPFLNAEAKPPLSPFLRTRIPSLLYTRRATSPFETLFLFPFVKPWPRFSPPPFPAWDFISPCFSGVSWSFPFERRSFFFFFVLSRYGLPETTRSTASGFPLNTKGSSLPPSFRPPLSPWVWGQPLTCGGYNCSAAECSFCFLATVGHCFSGQPRWNRFFFPLSSFSRSPPDGKSFPSFNPEKPLFVPTRTISPIGRTNLPLRRKTFDPLSGFPYIVLVFFLSLRGWGAFLHDVHYFYPSPRGSLFFFFFLPRMGLSPVGIIGFFFPALARFLFFLFFFFGTK